MTRGWPGSTGTSARAKKRSAAGASRPTTIDQCPPTSATDRPIGSGVLVPVGTAKTVTDAPGVAVPAKLVAPDAGAV